MLPFHFVTPLIALALLCSTFKVYQQYLLALIILESTNLRGMETYLANDEAAFAISYLDSSNRRSDCEE